VYDYGRNNSVTKEGNNMCDGGRIQLLLGEGGEAFWKSVKSQ